MASPQRIASRSRRTARRPPPALARNCALFLDIDGTLVEDAAKPDDVRIDEELAAALPGVATRLGNALALVTGRSIRGVDRLFPQLRLPMAGQHGSERRDAEGTIHVNAPDRSTFMKIRQILEVMSDRHPGLLLEDKGNTLALHYRDVPQLAAHVHRVLRSTVETTGGSLDLQPGKRVLEVRPGSRNKGTAITEFMREAPFAGRRPVFAGDDQADEFGFAVVESMGGWSIKVGKGLTNARYRLQDIAAVRRWLLTPMTEESSGPDWDHSACAASTSR
jgi:trehalose 6-phosphate phosphatase